MLANLATSKKQRINVSSWISTDFIHRRGEGGTRAKSMDRLFPISFFPNAHFITDPKNKIKS